MQTDLHELEKAFDQSVIEYNRLMYRLKNMKRHRVSVDRINALQLALKKNEYDQLQILTTLTTAINPSLRKNQ